MRAKPTSLFAVVGAATVCALVLGFATTAAAAGQPAYAVTLKLNKTVSEAGKFLAASGKVTGPQAAGKRVTIQRQYVGGPWTTVAVATVSASGKYAAVVETPRGGTTSFRVLKPKSSVRKAGVSPTRASRVYEWLYLANEGVYVQSGSVVEPYERTIGGTNYKRSMVAADGDTTLSFKLAGACTKFATRADYQVPGAGVPDTMDVVLNRVPLGGGPTSTATYTLNAGTPISISSSLVNTRFLTMELNSVDPAYFAVLGDPKVYCNADHLPSFSGDDL